MAATGATVRRPIGVGERAEDRNRRTGTPFEENVEQGGGKVPHGGGSPFWLAVLLTCDILAPALQDSISS